MYKIGYIPKKPKTAPPAIGPDKEARDETKLIMAFPFIKFSFDIRRGMLACTAG